MFGPPCRKCKGLDSQITSVPCLPNPDLLGGGPIPSASSSDFDGINFFKFLLFYWILFPAFFQFSPAPIWIKSINHFFVSPSNRRIINQTWVGMDRVPWPARCLKSDFWLALLKGFYKSNPGPVRSLNPIKRFEAEQIHHALLGFGNTKLKLKL